MKIHIVQKGDTLWKLAEKYGVNFEELKAVNLQLSDSDKLVPGMKVKIPSGAVAAKKNPVLPKKAAPKVKEAPIIEITEAPKAELKQLLKGVSLSELKDLIKEIKPDWHIDIDIVNQQATFIEKKEVVKVPVKEVKPYKPTPPPPAPKVQMPMPYKPKEKPVFTQPVAHHPCPPYPPCHPMPYSHTGMPPGMPGMFPGGMPGMQPGMPGMAGMPPGMAGMPPGMPPGMSPGMPGMPPGMAGMPPGMAGMPSGMPGMLSGMPGMPPGMAGMPSGMPGMLSGMPGMQPGMGATGIPDGTESPPWGNDGVTPTGQMAQDVPSAMTPSGMAYPYTAQMPTSMMPGFYPPYGGPTTGYGTPAGSSAGPYRSEEIRDSNHSNLTMDN